MSVIFVSKCLLPDTSEEGHKSGTTELRSKYPSTPKKYDPCDMSPDWKVVKLTVVKYGETVRDTTTRSYQLPKTEMGAKYHSTGS